MARARSGNEFLNHFATPSNPRLWFLGAVILTIVGDTTLQLLSLDFLDWSAWYLTLRLALFVLATVGVFWAVPIASRLWQQRRGGKPAIVPQAALASPPALIAFVSKNPTGPFRTAVDRFLQLDNPEKRRLRKVYLIHSPESKSVARDFEGELDTFDGLEAEKEGLLANFADLQSVYDITSKAINRALKEFDPADVVIDVTGGSGICTAGAVLASMDTDISLTYIRMEPDRPLEQGDLISVDVGWMERQNSTSTGKAKSAPATT